MNKSVTKDYSGKDPELLGGIGEKKSNGGTQYFTQNRIYSSFGVSTVVTTCCMPLFLVVMNEEILLCGDAWSKSKKNF